MSCELNKDCILSNCDEEQFIECTKRKKENILSSTKETKTEIIKEVPSNPLVEFKEYKTIFVNTHEHLQPLYDAIENQLGLEGETYYPIKKFQCYRIASLAQKARKFKIGREFFDNRIHGLYFAGAGFGKGSIKKLTQKKKSRFEGHAARINIEQLVGKQEKIGGKITETDGILNYDELNFDECGSLLNEEDNFSKSIMHDLRSAMDTYELNQLEKKQVAMHEKKTVVSPSRIQFFAHNVALTPAFFDTGTFRRPFAFNINPTQLNEEDAVANFFVELKKNEIEQYLERNQLETPELTFEKDAVLELKQWILSFNRFLLLHENQKVRALGQRLFFSGKQYFLKLIAIAAIENNETIITKKTVDHACFDAIQFLLETIENYCNRGSVLLSRDMWRTERKGEAMFLEWLWYNEARDRKTSHIMISEAQTKLGELLGITDRPARSVFSDLKEKGLIDSKQEGKHGSVCWITFSPSIDGSVIVLPKVGFDFKSFLLEKQRELFDLSREVREANGKEELTNIETSTRETSSSFIVDTKPSPPHSLPDLPYHSIRIPKTIDAPEGWHDPPVIRIDEKNCRCGKKGIVLENDRLYCEECWEKRGETK